MLLFVDFFAAIWAAALTFISGLAIGATAIVIIKSKRKDKAVAEQKIYRFERSAKYLERRAREAAERALMADNPRPRQNAAKEYANYRLPHRVRLRLF